MICGIEVYVLQNKKSWNQRESLYIAVHHTDLWINCTEISLQIVKMLFLKVLQMSKCLDICLCANLAAPLIPGGASAKKLHFTKISGFLSRERILRILYVALNTWGITCISCIEFLEVSAFWLFTYLVSCLLAEMNNNAVFFLREHINLNREMGESTH